MMTPQDLIRELSGTGVNFSLTVKTSGPQEAVNRWLPVLRERKADLIDLLKGPTASDFIDMVEERAAIQQFDGGLDKSQATASAYEAIKAHCERGQS